MRFRVSVLPVPESGNDDVTAGPILRSLVPKYTKTRY